eukprot:TRINITY_DN23012_c0_g1_i1.p1 TRINITY_DN23012_c0_g1~~TRINITY_DN23012_c0_g1_i1.p1  ORF type:complete len:816 (-),score=240.80 TRINITY_DN23012_c0_g1_i1:167-2614(-)
MDPAAVAEIKEAFKNADINGDGLISLDELGPLMQELCGFDEGEIMDLFAAMDTNEDGAVSYDEFIDWIMQEESDAVDEVLDALLEADELLYGHGDLMDELEEYELDFQQGVPSDVWMAAAPALGIAREEAEDIYDRIIEDGNDDDDDVVLIDGNPCLYDIFVALDIDDCDDESMLAIATALSAAQEAIESGESLPAEEQASEVALNAGLEFSNRYQAENHLADENIINLIKNEHLPVTAKQLEALKQALEKSEEEFLAKLQASKDNPSSLSATAGSNECIKRCKTEVKKIIDACKAEDKKFIDPEWDMTDRPDEVLWVDRQQPGYDCTVGKPAQYKRITELIEDPVLVENKERPGGVRQGQIGTCFLLGAMDAFVNFDPKSLQRVFVKHDIQRGVYGVRFCVDGEWNHVIVDDYVPCDEDGNILYCKSANPREIWPIILEKAYCKLHTCYEMCDGGWPTQAIFCFFGGVHGQFKVGKKDRTDPSAYFKKLQAARKRGVLMTCGFEVQAGYEGKGGGKCGEDMLPCGLIGGHAYSVLKLVEAEGNQLICCRNPWGSGEWTGKWSDKDAEGEWTDAMKEATGYKKADDGLFWMSIQDFVNNTSAISYSRTFGVGWSKVSKYSAFQKSPMKVKALWPYSAGDDSELTLVKGEEYEVTSFLGGWLEGKQGEQTGMFPANYVSFMDRPVAHFSLGMKAKAAEGAKEKIVIMLMQPDKARARSFYKHKQSGLNYKDTQCPAITLLVVDSEGKALMKKTAKEYMIWGEFAVPESKALTVYVTSTEGKGQRFTLRSYSKNCDVAIQQVQGTTLHDIEGLLQQV